MFERFTERARRVVVASQGQAMMLGDDYVGTEHVLLGLIDEAESVAVEVLESLDVDLAALRQKVEAIARDGQRRPSHDQVPFAPGNHIGFMPRTKLALELAMREADELDDAHIGTEHILLGLIREGQGVAWQVLLDVGADRDRVRQQVRQVQQSRPTYQARTAGRAESQVCALCGCAIGFMRSIFTNSDVCSSCNKAAGATIVEFKREAPYVIRGDAGTASPEWENLLNKLDHANVPISYALGLIQRDSQSYIDDLFSHALSSGVIDGADVRAIDDLAKYLRVEGSIGEEWRLKVRCGLMRAELMKGRLPAAITPPDIQYKAGEIFYLDVPARYRFVRKSGEVSVSGRILVGNTKVRFVGQRSPDELGPWAPIDGWEIALSKILKVDTYDNGFDLVATQKKGSGFYFVDDGGVTSETIKLVLKIANRQTDGFASDRDSRQIPQEIKNAVFKRDGGRCQGCHSKSYLEYDHIIPLSKGGATSVNNLQLLCRRCNMKKGSSI